MSELTITFGSFKKSVRVDDSWNIFNKIDDILLELEEYLMENNEEYKKSVREGDFQRRLYLE